MKKSDNRPINWQHIFDPGTVAVIGASNNPGSWGHGIMKHLLRPKRRKIYPVNPKAAEVMGVKSYASVLDIPDPVELVVIAVASPRVPELIRECVQKGIKAAVVISGGFGESGGEGVELERDLVEVARKGDIRFIGPNTMGHADTDSQLSTLAWTFETPPGPVALVAQSGNYGHRILHRGMMSGIGFSKFICTGNEADLHLEDYFEHVMDDDNTRIIAVYIEGLREGRRFFELARKTTPRKPVIAIKAGATRASAAAAMSHTATLAGSDRIYAAAFHQAGVLRVEDDDELCDVVTALLYQPLPHGRKIGILTIGGGLGVMSAEACEKEGLEIPALAPATIETLNRHLPPRWSHANPVDMAGISMVENPVIFPSLYAMMDDKDIDAILLQAPLGANTDRLATMFDKEEIKAYRKAEKAALDELSRRVKHDEKPVFMVKPAVEFATDPEVASLFSQQGIPVYPSPRRAARVLNHLAWYRDYLDSIGK
ncbi:MAG: CoA-binding protein [Dehalococcoidia bacterium]